MPAACLRTRRIPPIHPTTRPPSSLANLRAPYRKKKKTEKETRWEIAVPHALPRAVPPAGHRLFSRNRWTLTWSESDVARCIHIFFSLSFFFTEGRGKETGAVQCVTLCSYVSYDSEVRLDGCLVYFRALKPAAARSWSRQFFLSAR